MCASFIPTTTMEAELWVVDWQDKVTHAQQDGLRAMQLQAINMQGIFGNFCLANTHSGSGRSGAGELTKGSCPFRPSSKEALSRTTSSASTQTKFAQPARKPRWYHTRTHAHTQRHKHRSHKQKKDDAVGGGVSRCELVDYIAALDAVFYRHANRHVFP